MNEYKVILIDWWMICGNCLVFIIARGTLFSYHNWYSNKLDVININIRRCMIFWLLNSIITIYEFEGNVFAIKIMKFSKLYCDIVDLTRTKLDPCNWKYIRLTLIEIDGIIRRTWLWKNCKFKSCFIIEEFGFASYYWDVCISQANIPLS